ncbi:MAG: hypothetical protein IJ408_00675 [Clostridia bacterium]|nr:hypothetical protein [Clostridia bacterium]
MSNLMIGWSEINITPDKKISLAGQFAERISEYVEKELTATAFSVDNGTEQMIMVSCDLVSISFNLVEAIRARLADNTVGIDPEKIIISAIHTHTGPVYPRKQRSSLYGGVSGFKAKLQQYLPEGKEYIDNAPVTNNPDIATSEEVFELLVNNITKVILDAWNNRKAGSYVNAFGRAVVGLCRRATYNDGSSQMWGDTNKAAFEALEAGNDSGIELLYVFDDNKKLTGIVANLACPAQCVQHRLFVSPDFWGEVKVLLREKFGDDIFLLALCSAAGDQCPVDLIRWVEPESDVHDPNITRANPLKRKADPSMFDLAGMKKTGRRIAREIIDVYEDGLDELITDPEFVHEVHWMQLPVRRVTLAEQAQAEREIETYLRNKPGNVDYNDAASLLFPLGIVDRAKLQDVMEVLDTEVHIIKLGNIAFASNPFELFLDYGNKIKARSHAEQTFLVQLANGCEGYLPTEKAENGGHYSGFVGSGTVGHIGGDQLVRETLKNINKMF